jgi:hypothetical protein
MHFQPALAKRIAPYRLRPSRDAVPNPARPLLAQNSFLLLAVATFVPDSWKRRGWGNGSAALKD